MCLYVENLIILTKLTHLQLQYNITVKMCITHYGKIYKKNVVGRVARRPWLRPVFAPMVPPLTGSLKHHVSTLCAFSSLRLIEQRAMSIIAHSLVPI